jgi:polyadenylate-binding protein 2
VRQARAAQRVTLIDRFAYIEFVSPESVKNSEALNQTLFKGRVLQVTPKRTNVPQFVRGRGRGRGSPRGMRGGGRIMRGRGGRGRGHQPY